MKTVTLKEEYEKNKNIRPEDAKSLMEWTTKQPYLPKITELEAILFLNCYEGSIELAKGLVDTYFTSRTHCPEFFENRKPKKLVNDMEVVLYYPLESSNTFYSVYIDTDPYHLNLNEQIKIMWMVIDIWLLQNGAMNGCEFIVDMEGIQFGHIAKLNISTMRKQLYILQEAAPFKINKIHVVNVTSLAEKLLNILKPFIKVELLEKIVFYTNGLEALKQFVPHTSIPKNLGGNGPTLKEMHGKMKNMLMENADYFEMEEIYKRVDENRRPGKPRSSSDLFGIEGTFKKLDID